MKSKEVVFWIRVGNDNEKYKAELHKHGAVAL
jgi:hypothetical protein